MGNDRRRNSVKANKPSTSKSIDNITLCPKTHKQKFVKNSSAASNHQCSK